MRKSDYPAGRDRMATPYLSRTLLVCLFLFRTEAMPAEEQKEGEAVEGVFLSLRSAVVEGIRNNLDVQIQELNAPVEEQNIRVERSTFDPRLEATFTFRDQETPTASAFAEDNEDEFQQIEGTSSLRKRFRLGLESGLSLETYRSENNSTVDALRPQYRSILMLDFTQPLLRDFGVRTNTASLRITENRARQAVYAYKRFAQEVGGQIESTYYDLAEAFEVLEYRMESRQLAMELLEGNRERFEAGLAPVSEVQEAETVLASRDEEIIAARQQVEVVENRLKNLLGIRKGSPLYAPSLIPTGIPKPDGNLPDVGEAYRLAMEKRPDIKAQRLIIANRDIRTGFEKNQGLPRVDLEARVGVNGLSGNEREVSFAPVESSTPYGGDYMDSLRRAVEGSGTEVFAGLRFSYPLGNRAARARVVRSDLEKRQALYGLNRLEEDVETEVRESIVVLRRSWERIGVAERFVRLAEITLDQEGERLREGLSDTFRMVNFQDAVISARIRRLTAIVDYHQGRALLSLAEGTVLERFGIRVEEEYEGLLGTDEGISGERAKARGEREGSRKEEEIR
jgi:outer membrane protein TolC